jgi:hypothetical protein
MRNRIYGVRFANSHSYSAKEKLEIVSASGGAAPFARQPHRLQRRKFELFLKYTAKKVHLRFFGF